MTKQGSTRCTAAFMPSCRFAANVGSCKLLSARYQCPLYITYFATRTNCVRPDNPTKKLTYPMMSIRSMVVFDYVLLPSCSSRV